MALDDLRKRLSRPGEDFSRRTQREPLPRHHEQVSSGWTPEPERAPERLWTRRILVWGIGAAVLITVFSVGAFLLFSGRLQVGSNTQKLVELSVTGGEEIIAGKKATWKVRIANSNTIALENAVITFEYPLTAQALTGELTKAGLPRERKAIGTVQPGGVVEETFSAIVFGAPDEEFPGKVYFEYRPQDSSVRLSKEVDYRSRVTSSLLGVEVAMPEELRPGQEVEATLSVVSSAESTYHDLALRVEYPKGFDFISAEPKPIRSNTIWLIGDLTQRDRIEVKIRGKVRETMSAPALKIAVGLFDRTDNKFTVLTSKTQQFRIAQALLEVAFATIEGENDPGVTAVGSTITARVRWKNNLPVAVSNVVVEVAFDGSSIDLRSITSARGDFDAGRNALRWVPGRISELSVLDPGESGEFDFEFRIKQSVSTSHNIARLVATITTAEKPVGYEGVDIAGQRDIEYKVATRPTFSQKGYYYDSRLTNAGPLPPKVGRETTFLIVWSVVNTTNDVDGVEISATLPSYIRWTGTIIPSDSTLTFDEKNRTVRWTPGKIPAGTGYAARAREVAFQVALTPSLPQVKKYPELISEARFTGRDAFTGQPLSRKATEVTTSLPDDPRAVEAGGAVVE